MVDNLYKFNIIITTYRSVLGLKWKLTLSSFQWCATLYYKNKCTDHFTYLKKPTYTYETPGILQILFRTNTYCAFAPVAAVSVVKDSWSSAEEFAAAAPEDAELEGFMAKTRQDQVNDNEALEVGWWRGEEQLLWIWCFVLKTSFWVFFLSLFWNWSRLSDFALDLSQH